MDITMDDFNEVCNYFYYESDRHGYLELVYCTHPDNYKKSCTYVGCPLNSETEGE